MRLFNFDVSPDSSYVCDKCNKVVTRATVTCAKYERRAHRAHTKDERCLLGRCQCPAELPIIEILPEDEWSPDEVGRTSEEGLPSEPLFPGEQESRIVLVPDDASIASALVAKAASANTVVELEAREQFLC